MAKELLFESFFVAKFTRFIAESKMAVASQGESTLRRTEMFGTMRLFGWRIKADLIVSQGSKSKGVRRGEISINWGDFLEGIMAKESVFLDLPFG